jgi:hypothetical protein
VSDLIIRLTNYVRSRQKDAVILAGPRRSTHINGRYKSQHAAAENRKKNGKAIFVIEYLKNSANIEMAKKRMQELGFVLYISNAGWLASQATAVPTKGQPH